MVYCPCEPAAGAAANAAGALAADPMNAPAPQDDPERACTSCRGASRPVTRKTMLLMLKPGLFERVGGGEYRFCASPDCRVVYFAEGAGPSFTTEDLRVRVGLKEREDPIPLCYCFGFDEASAREEIRSAGRSMLPGRITALIRQGACACPARNPSGSCCLGEVNRAIGRLMDEAVGPRQPV